MRRIIHIKLLTVRFYFPALINAFFLQIFKILIKALIPKLVRPQPMKLNRFISFGKQYRMVVCVPFLRGSKSVFTKNFYRFFFVLFAKEKKINIGCLSEFGDGIKPCHGIAL